jgi:hypothetical protein
MSFAPSNATWPNAADERVGPKALAALICGRTGAHVETGVAVAANSSMSLEFPYEQWSDGLVSDWLAAVAKRRWSLFCDLGGWLDERGIVHLDVVLVVPRMLSYVAKMFGRLTGQHSMYDLDRLRTVIL